jgi:hypothetical protein
MSAIGASWILGFLMMIVLAACINPDLQAVLSSPFGQPMAQIYFDAIGKHGAMGMMALLFICQFQMGLSTVSKAPLPLFSNTDPSVISWLQCPDSPGHFPVTALCRSAASFAQSQPTSPTHPSAPSGAAPYLAQYWVSYA